jgi:hypothetical protein
MSTATTTNLKACPACERSVSARAPACPHCGEPFKLAAANPGGINMRDPVHVAGVIIAVIVGLGAIGLIVTTLFF